MLETRPDNGRCDAEKRSFTSLEMAPPRVLNLKPGAGVFEINGTLLSIIPGQGPSLEKWDLQTSFSSLGRQAGAGKSPTIFARANQ